MKYLAFLAIMFLATNCFAYDLTLTIPDDKAVLVADSFCKAYNYNERKLKDETKEQFTKRCISGFIKDVVKSTKAQEAAEQARQAALANPDNDVEIQ